MARYRFTATAQADVNEILAYIARDNRQAAWRLIERFEGRAEKLAHASGIGRPRDELRPGLRSFAVGNYVLFYLPVSDGIEIIRVLHGRRDIDAIFAEDEA